MSLDPVLNFGKVTVSTGYAAGAVTVVLVSGHGAKLPDPSVSGAFNLVWWNSTLYPDPADDPNVEIVRCTARTTDTLTITRAQESTSDVAHNVANSTYKMILSLTKKMKDDIEAGSGGLLVLNSLPVDLAYSGLTVTLTAGEILAAGDNLYFKSDGKVWKAKADSTTTMPCIGLAMAAAAASASVVVLLKGYYRNDSLYNFTIGGQASAAAGLIYVSEATSGLSTQTRPATAGNIVQIIGHAKSADIIYFDPSPNWVEII